MREIPTPPGRPPRAVLFDAMGTLVRMRAPAPELGRRLAAAGHPHPPDVVEAALRLEIVHYRANHLRGRTAAGVRALRLECAGVLSAALGGDTPPPPLLTELLMGSLRFDLMPGAPAILRHLRARGVRLAVVSNWDASLVAVLRGLGVLARFDVVCVSAIEGVAKPDPAIFRIALERLGVRPECAVHCGDDVRHDGVGAREAGVHPILIERTRPLVQDGFTRISSLDQLTSLTAVGHADPRTGAASMAHARRGSGMLRAPRRRPR